MGKELSSYKLRKSVTVDKCKRCGYNEFAGSLHVHHMNKNRYNNNISNLIVLCANCHRALHHNRWELEDIGIKTPDVQTSSPNSDWITPEIVMMAIQEKMRINSDNILLLHKDHA